MTIELTDAAFFSSITVSFRLEFEFVGFYLPGEKKFFVMTAADFEQSICAMETEWEVRCRQYLVQIL